MAGLQTSVDMPKIRHHGCSFYTDRKEQWALAAHFVQSGLKQGRRCLYLAAENGPDVVCEAFAAQGIPVSAYLDETHLQILRLPNVCRPSEILSLDALLGQVETALATAQTAQYRGLHVAIEMSWVLEEPAGLARLAEYEAAINGTFASEPVALYCQYNRRRFPAEVLLDVLKTHPQVQTEGAIHDNPYYLPPHIFLKQNKREQFYWYLTNLGGADPRDRASDVADDVSERPPADAGAGSGPVWSPWEQQYSGNGPFADLGVSPEERIAFSDGLGHWQIYCLGELKVFRHDGTRVSWDVAKGATTKVKTLFAFLLEQKQQGGATKERLVDLLWPEQDDLDKGLARLYHTVHCLRLALEPSLNGYGKASQYVLYEGGRYILSLPEHSWIDAVAFEQLCYQGEHLLQREQDEDALACFQAAERLYAGEFLADIPLEYTGRLDDDWCWSRRYWLSDVYVKLHLYLAKLHLKGGASREALMYYRKALTLDPMRQEAHEGMMRTLGQAGRRDALLRQYRLYQELAQRLNFEIGDAGALYDEVVETVENAE